MSISIGFTVEGMLLYIIGNQLQKHLPKIDTVYINEEIKKGNKFKISCLEAFLKVQAINADMNLITALIDEGEDDLDISIAPLFQFMKIYGVDKTLPLLLEKVTDNDWKALIKLNDLLDELQEQILRKEFLNKIIRYIPFQNQYDTELGIRAIKVIDNESARLYFDKIDSTLEFLVNDSILLSILGDCYNRFAEYIKALEYYHKGLEIELKTIGEEHPSVAISYNNIGSIWDTKGEYDKALEYYHKSLSIRLKTIGEEHPSVAVSYNNIGFIWEKKGEYDNALEYYHKGLEIELKTIGEEHDKIAATYGNIGLSYANKGEYEKGMEYLQKGLEIRLKILDVNHPKVGILNRKIGKVFVLKGEYENAVEQHQKCLEIRINNFGIDNILTKESFSDIKSIYKLLGKEQELQTWLEKLIEKN